ncbi:MAG: ThuA domain-containing protein [Pirellulales bacterium]|nr:ThuA domain-containing protein [Pirellulales bacterium]
MLGGCWGGGYSVTTEVTIRLPYAFILPYRAARGVAFEEIPTMRRREMLLTTGAALSLAAFPRGWVAAEDKRKPHVLFFTRSQGFEHSVINRGKDEKPGHAETVFTELGQQNGFDVTVTKDGRVFDGDLDQFDAFFFFTTGDLTQPSRDGGEPMSAAGKERLLAAVAGGKGFLGSHCASDTFHSQGDARERQNPPDPYIAMIGGEFISHGPQQLAKQEVIDPKFPGVEKLGDSFALLDEWYALKNFADDLHVILLQITEFMKGNDYARPNYPSTWARMHGQGRVFYTSMGHREDVWTNPIFQGIVLGAVSWAVGNVDVDVAPNLSSAAPDAHTLKNA